MAHIKKTLGVSVLAHAFALAAIGFIMPKAAGILEQESTPVELVAIEQGARETMRAEAAPLKKVKGPKPKQAEKVNPQPEPVREPVQEAVEEVKKETKPEPAVPAPVVQRTASPETPVQKHISVPAQAVSPAVKVESEALPARDNDNAETAFNNYVNRKVGRAKLPLLARQRGYEGVVTVAFKVAPDGKVSGLKVVAPCEFEVLNKAACEAIQRAAPFNDGPEAEKKVREIEMKIKFSIEK